MVKGSFIRLDRGISKRKKPQLDRLLMKWIERREEKKKNLQVNEAGGDNDTRAPLASNNNDVLNDFIRSTQTHIITD